MRVIFLEAVQNFGGARKSTLELASRLNDSGVECLVVDFWGSCIPFKEEAIAKSVNVSLLDPRDTPIILGNKNKLIQIKNYLNYFFLWLKYRKRLKEIVETFQPTLIVVNNAKTLSLLRTSSDYKICYFARGWFLPKTVKLFNRYLIQKKVSLFAAVSQSTRQSIFAGKFSKLENIYVVPNAFDTNKIEIVKRLGKSIVPWHQEKDQRPFKILHCGGFLEAKGQLLLIDIAKRLFEKRVNFKILIVGIIYKGQQSEVFYAKLLKAIEIANLQDYFEIILNQPNVLEYFDQVDVLVHPSHTEGLPRVAMEAMAFGKPVIGNSVGGMTDYVLNNYTGYLTNYNRVSDYADAILKLISDRNHYQFLSYNSENLIKNTYTPEGQVDSFLKIL